MTSTRAIVHGSWKGAVVQVEGAFEDSMGMPFCLVHEVSDTDQPPLWTGVPVSEVETILF